LPLHCDLVSLPRGWGEGDVGHMCCARITGKGLKKGTIQGW
jgi:hypothetical protein